VDGSLTVVDVPCSVFRVLLLSDNVTAQGYCVYVYVQMVQPAMSSSSEVFAGSPRPIRTVVEPADSLLAAGVTALPYRTRVDYRADVPPHIAPVDHVTSQPRTSRDVASSLHAINVTSSTPRDARTTIHIGDHLDRNKQR